MPEQPRIFHIPHAALMVPPAERRFLVISDAELDFELLKMTDGYTDEMFCASAVPGDEIIEFPVSRLVLDPERFVQRGMGVVYTERHDRKSRRQNLEDKDRLVAEFYVPHHLRPEEAVARHLAGYNCCGR